MFTSTLSCPHCNQVIKGSAFKGFMGIKSCPHCNNAIKFKKAPPKKILLAFSLWLIVFMPILAVYVSIFGPEMNIGLMSLIIISYFPILFYLSKQISFEKDE